MVCGTWLSKANENASFLLDVPRGDPDGAGMDSRTAVAGRPAPYRTVVVNDLPLEVRAVDRSSPAERR